MPHRFSASRALLAALTASAGIVGVVTPSEAKPPHAGQGRGRQPVIVVLDDSVADPGAVAAEQAADYGGSVEQVFRNGLKGWSGHLDQEGVRRAGADPRVEFVEPDQVFQVDAVQTSGVPWGVDRVDQPTRPLDGTFTYTSTGAGVTAYVVDTGIRSSHEQFDGRARSGFDAYGGDGSDCHGHGTHVAGTIGGRTYGVAKDVSLVNVRVFGCDGSGSTSKIVAGLDWIVSHHPSGTPAVANLSFGGSTSSTIDSAVKRLIADGVSAVVAAGNQKRDACKGSPARVSDALTVAATDQNDKRASFSNYGSCVDLFAPGVSILSTLPGSDTATGLKSGTSMATPHVAGVAAQFLQTVPVATPKMVTAAIRDLTVKEIVSSSKTSKDDLLYTNF